MVINQDLVFGFHFSELTVYPDRNYVLLDKYRYDLASPLETSGDVLYISFADIIRIFSPEYKDTPLPEDAVTRNGIPYVALCDFAEKTLNKVCSVIGGRFIFSDQPVGDTRQKNLFLDLWYRNKKVGDLYYVFWNEVFQKLLPYRLYIPTWYSAETPMKLLVLFHGGGSSSDEIFEVSGNTIQQFAEKRGYILAGLDGGVRDSVYGCPYMPEGADVEINPDVPENPYGLSSSALQARADSEAAIEQVLSIIGETYNIDEEHRYLFGNSMGGMGTFHYPLNHKGYFRAAVPAGAVPDTRFFNYSGLQGISLLLVCGTEDYHGFDYMLKGYHFAKDCGLDIRLLPVGGGGHVDCWVSVLPEIFDFLEENR